MREFTSEEKKLIVNTPLTAECFDIPDTYCKRKAEQEMFAKYISVLDTLRHICQFEYDNKDDFELLTALIPNSYKVVNLCAERKDICKAKHMVPETPHYGKESKGEVEEV